MRRVCVALMGMVLAVGCSMPSRFEGAVQITHQGVVRASGQYESGVRTGEWTYYDAFGSIQGSGIYQDGKMVNGMEIVFASNGQKLSEGAWVNGKKDGHWVAYYRSGSKKEEGLYVNGKKTGVWQEYDPSGFYVVEKVWEDGQMVGWREFKQGRLGNPF